LKSLTRTGTGGNALSGFSRASPAARAFDAPQPIDLALGDSTALPHPVANARRRTLPLKGSGRHHA